MEWFQGPIPQAIQTAKQNNALFIVYVRGKNGDTEKMDKVWTEDKVASACRANRCTAVQIQADSEDGKFFGQIYPIILIPSTYFIGPNGMPVEVTGGFVEAESFVKNINTAQKKLQESLGTQAPGPAASANTSPSLSTGAEPVAGGSNSQGPSKPLEERVEIAKQKMEQKRNEKEEKEKEEAKKREQERRNLGRDMQKLKQYQEDRQRKEVEEQIKKDREENKRMKEKIKQQIARDREERAERYRKEKQEQEKNLEEKRQVKLQAQQQAAAAESAKKSEKARLQIRLPDGSSISNIFDSSDTLEAVHQFITVNTGAEMSVSTTFPKRTFTEEDRSETLMSLGLAPTAVIIAVSKRYSSHKSGGEGGGGTVSNTGFLSMILAPFLMLWNFLYSFLFGGSGEESPAPSTQQSATQSSQTRQRPGTSYQRRNLHSNRDGNITRFRNIQDNDDDENATWNGNSTQQM